MFIYCLILFQFTSKFFMEKILNKQVKFENRKNENSVYRVFLTEKFMENLNMRFSNYLGF